MIIANVLILIVSVLCSNILAVNREDYRLKYSEEIELLKNALIERGVSRDWIETSLASEDFQVYENIEEYFTNLPEHRVNRGEMNVQDYKQRFDVDSRVVRGQSFIEEHREVLISVQEKNGIDYELVVAILGMETNYAYRRHRGRFNVFDTLVSQYLLIPRRQRFALNELSALYEFSVRTDKDRSYFSGSFAGASGWGQFIPSSLVAYFVSADGIPENTDIFSIEDTLFSIENYLHAHNLSSRTINSDKHKRDAVFAYNRSNAYVEAVLYIYEELMKMRIN
jgi:membrane-bound lytic murein transglycosylase B